MIARSFVVVAPIVALVALTACATGPAADEEEATEQTAQALCTLDGCEPPPREVQQPPSVPKCNCTTYGPHGYLLGVVYENGKYVCKELNKCCAPGNSCSPSTYTSTWNPCYWPWPYLRCNYYGNCYCSSSP